MESSSSSTTSLSAPASPLFSSSVTDLPPSALLVRLVLLSCGTGLDAPAFLFA
ncbi:hypothetical protein PICMEDRAFT_17563 [Pichia membranifaciens NRRL Y-2026]|uniref:Uncharacterized protein n=1 Tax=Pichia membranifaciens NRRL Y-2026 TaxID=763406 RepID=A0A1E3NG06_9ASCO|nr:hypothetical protein PICMEDRAFT_17563 [Pichia membranifaciens NRRL Y-2026]ODQ45064.1 hypothetical protein PICMEDRAFT_17563 [Pichia membranifaciens NRRL Y-2026]